MGVEFKRSSAGLALLLLAGCGHSPPTHFYTLDPTPPSRPAAVSASAPRAPIQLDAVHIPAALDRPQVVTQLGANRVDVHDFDQWASPLGEMMRRTLAQDLLARLPEGAFVLPDAPRPQVVRGLVVNVLQIDAAPGGRVALQASWTLMTAGTTRAALIRNVQLSADAGPGPQGTAAAMSQLLGQLADQIVEGVGTA
ncbi:MAG: membrane integrity-associated transporter subunit PqiC [Caulobacteraceae bacterium]|nr:membrane integrity-associated transporter subunit PqiC [Caulobacteraceae bacterium]